MTRKRKTSRRGFTLIEVLLALAILVILTAFFGVLWYAFFSTNNFLNESLTLERDATTVLEQFVSELRAAAPSSLGAYPIEIATNNAIAFYANIDGDVERERIEYFRSGSDLKRSVVNPVGSPLTYSTTTAPEMLVTVLSGLAPTTTPLFSYYDSGFAGTTTPLTQPVPVAAVRLVKVTVTIDADPAKLPPPVTVTTQVTVRNLKDNL